MANRQNTKAVKWYVDKRWIINAYPTPYGIICCVSARVDYFTLFILGLLSKFIYSFYSLGIYATD